MEVFVVAIFALVVGSFLNVVIARLPRILERQWQRDCGQPVEENLLFNLAWPGSHCPQCQTPIHWYHNIPVVSYVWLRGRCQTCQQAIGWHYPAVELTAMTLALLAWHWFGLSFVGLVFTLLFWVLLVLSVIDSKHMLLPDQLTLPLLWLGLLVHVAVAPSLLPSAVIGAAAGYLSLWSVYWLFRLTTGREGMGYGDFKLLAALGAWLGWQALPAIILFASVAGVLVGGLIWLRRRASTAIPFGPFLSAGALFYMAWQLDLIQQNFITWGTM